MIRRYALLIVLGFAFVAGYIPVDEANAGPKPKSNYINIAVYPMKAAGANEAVAQALTSITSYELSRSKTIRIIEESALKAVLDKQGLSMSGACDDSECQIEIGKILNAQKLILGDVSKLGAKYIITMKIIDVKTGRTDFTDRQDCRCPEDQLDGAVAILAGRIRMKLEGKPVEDVTQPDNKPGPSLQPNLGDLNVMTQPDGADIYLDAELKGKSPMLIQGVKPGAHQITITKTGYSVLNKGIQVVDGRITEVNEILLARSGEAMINSNPPGAKVFVDGVFKGDTPVKVTGLVVGNHKVKLVHDDYQETEGEVNVEYQQVANYNATLLSKPGRVLITSTPEGATVYIDGVEKGKTLYAGEVPPGNHEIRIALSGYSDENKSVNIQSNKSETYDFVLKKGSSYEPPFRAEQPPGKELSFVDDFSDNSKDWCMGPDEWGTWKLEKGELRRVQTKGSSWCSQDPEFTDFTYSVRLRRISGKDSNPYGIIFRKQDRNFYAYFIDSTGYYKLQKYENEEWSTIIDWKESKDLYPDVNVIKVKAVGSKIELYANGKFLDSTNDSSLKSGKFGLVVGNTPLEVAFDDLSIKSEGPASFQDRSSGAFYDNFSSNANDWCTGTDEYGSWSLVGGEYIREQTNGSSWCSQDTEFKNFDFEVKVRRISGKDSNPYGIIFRKQDRNFYAFFIDSTGYYKLQKYENEDWSTIIDWKETSYLKGNVSNVIKVRANGANFELYANGHFIDSAKDYSLPKGKFGVVVGNWPLKIAFDDLSIKELQ